ncbi:hypothetical protein GGH92_010342, partial [Coemansia sp. RSA 2673]
VQAFCQLFSVSVNERGIKLGEREGKRLVFKDPAQRPQRLQRNLRVVGAKFLSTPMQAINSNIAQQFLVPAGPMIAGSHIGLAPSAAWPAQMMPSGRVPNGQVSSGGFGMPSAAPFGGNQRAQPAAAASAFSFPKSSSFPVAQPAESFAGSRTDMFRMPPTASSTAPAFHIKQGESAAEAGPNKATTSAPSFGISGSSKFGFTTAGAAQKSANGPATSTATSLFSTTATAPNAGGELANFGSAATASLTTLGVPPTPGPQKLFSAAPAPIPAVPAIPAPDVVWNKPRPRINWTSLSNALYDELLGSLILDVAKPLAVRAKEYTHVVNTLAEDIADAIVNYTSAFVAYEESYRCALLAQADSFRRKSLMRMALRRWSMEA